jgi:predicted nucleotidyltransferase
MESIPLTPREYHARRDRERLAARESLRSDVLERTRQAVRLHAPRYPSIRAVYLFGSLVQPGRFSPLSDVDVAVDADDIREETPFWRALEEDLERNVDLRPRAGAIARAVATYGEICYEREVGPPGE